MLMNLFNKIVYFFFTKKCYMMNGLNITMQFVAKDQISYIFP